MKEQRYVLCDSCNGKIYLGKEVYCFEGYCGVYCSGECFAEAYATQKILTTREAENCGCDILDDNAIEKEKMEIKKEISMLEDKLNILNKMTSQTDLEKSDSCNPL